MATTQFFEGVLKDKGGEGEIDIEIGRSSFYDGESLIYIRVGDEGVIVDEAQGRTLYNAISRLGAYLGYDKSPEKSR